MPLRDAGECEELSGAFSQPQPPIGELKIPLSGPFHRWRGEKGRFASPFLVSSYTESTLALVAGGASKAAMQRGPFPWTKS